MMGDPKTPAPRRDQIKGSAKNPAGSARSAASGRGIKLSAATTKSLRSKAREYADLGVTYGMLAAVWRRGAGAYSTSHRPGVSRAAWAMARVNAFLHLVAFGAPKNPNYVQDNDLLPGAKPSKRKRKRTGRETVVIL